MKTILKVMSCIFLSLSFLSCAQQPKDTVTVERLPTAVNSQNLNAFQKSELYQILGKNVLLAAGSCVGSSLAVIGTAIGESVPMVSYMTTLAADMSMLEDRDSQGEAKFDHFRDKTKTATVGGSIVAAGVDLLKAAHALIFEDSSKISFKNTTTSYAATEALGKHFNSVDGACGKSGRNISNVLRELRTRN